MSDPLRILVLHGPNLNLLGTREPEIYGSETLQEIDLQLKSLAKERGAELRSVQSNHEGELIDRIQEARGWADGLLINPGAFTHTSVALRDTLLAVALPQFEVHLTNGFSREEFLRHSSISPIATGVISGFGPTSSRLGLDALLAQLNG